MAACTAQSAKFPQKVMVYDIPTRRWVFSLDPPKQNLEEYFGVALSHSGSKVAILRNGIVELHEIGVP